MVGSSKHGVDRKLKQGAWLRAAELSGTSAMLKGFYTEKLDNERIAALAIEALMRRFKSPASTLGVIRNVSGAIRFFLDTRGGSKPGVALTGDNSVVLLRDYLKSVAERGRTGPGAVKASLSTLSEALGVPWPLDNPSVCVAEQVESSEILKHAPPMDLANDLHELTLLWRSETAQPRGE